MTIDKDLKQEVSKELSGGGTGTDDGGGMAWHGRCHAPMGGWSMVSQAAWPQRD